MPSLLVLKAQSGDRAALNEVLQHLERPLFAHIAIILGDDDGARDVLQDVLLTVARKIGMVRDPQWTRAWAYRIANREALRAARRARRYHEVLEDAAREINDTSFPTELSVDIEPLIATLPPAAQAVIRMHYIEQMSYVEISEALEIPLGTVKSRMAYGLDRLRRSWAMDRTRA